MRQKWFLNSGFTLIEILVSILIFSVVLLGAAKGYLLVDHQMKLLSQKKMVASRVQELVQRRYRNPNEIYFEQSLWDFIEARGVIDNCAHGENCVESELRHYDVHWFQTEIHNNFDNEAFILEPCAEQHYTCLKISSENQPLMSFIVGLSRNAL